MRSDDLKMLVRLAGRSRRFRQFDKFRFKVA